jgi:hypothetical protein
VTALNTAVAALGGTQTTLVAVQQLLSNTQAAVLHVQESLG